MIKMTVNIIADAVCGASHRICGAPCQDRYAIYTINQVSCVALCDGAGSKEMSHLGAQAAANAVARRLVEDFSELVGAPKAAMSNLIANTALNALEQTGYSAETVACTLLFCVTDGIRWICGNLGDGRVFICDETPQLLIDAEHGEICGETFFVSSPNAACHLTLRSGSLQNNELIVLTTDGAGNLLYDEQNQCPAAAVGTISQWTCDFDKTKVYSLLSQSLSEAFADATNDDVSIVLLYPKDRSAQR